MHRCLYEMIVYIFKSSFAIVRWLKIGNLTIAKLDLNMYARKSIWRFSNEHRRRLRAYGQVMQ